MDKVRFLWPLLLMANIIASGCSSLTGQIGITDVVRQDTTVYVLHDELDKTKTLRVRTEFRTNKKERLVRVEQFYSYEKNSIDDTVTYNHVSFLVGKPLNVQKSVGRVDSIFCGERLKETISYTNRFIRDTSCAFTFDNHKMDFYVDVNENAWVPYEINKYKYSSRLNGFQIKKTDKIFDSDNRTWVNNNVKIFSYNQSQQLTKEKHIFGWPSSIVREKYQYLYNKSDQLIKVKHWRKDANKKYLCVQTDGYEYDDMGRIIKKSSSSDNAVNLITAYVYDSVGRKTMEKVIINDEPSNITTYLYDDNGRLLEKKRHNTFINGELVQDQYDSRVIIYCDDDLGRLKESIEKSYNNGCLLWESKTVYNYNEKIGSVSIEEHTQFSNGEERTIFRYER